MSKDVLLIVVSVAVLAALSAATFFCSRRRPQSPSQRSDALGHDVERGRVSVAGLDEAVLAAYPTLVFSSSPSQHVKEKTETDKKWGEDDEEKAAGSTAATAPAGDTAAQCAVCQADYADGDELRLLPECRHAFHRRCVDRWLRRRPTCPVCRRAS